MENVVTGSNVNQATSDAETPVSFPKWMKWLAGLWLVMSFLGLYQRDWKSVCLYSGMFLTYYGGLKEKQMSRWVKVVWAVVTIGLMILASVLLFKSLLSRGR
ncbi:MAG: hypothetical protein ACKVZH_14595 [Blastocatellia bacterium]